MRPPSSHAPSPAIHVRIPFSLEQLRVFCAVCETGSFSHACDEVSLSMPAVSAKIKQLELGMGIELLTRSNKGVEPTPEGKRLLAFANDLLMRARVVAEVLNTSDARVHGLVKLAATTSANIEFLPQLLAGFLERNPHCDIQVDESTSENVVEQVREGRADIGIGVCYEPEAYPDLRIEHFRQHRLVLVMGAGSRFMGRDVVSFSETLSQNYVSLPVASAMHKRLVARAAGVGTPLRARIHVPNFDAMARVVERSVGIAVMPERTARRLSDELAIGIAQLSDSWACMDLAIFTRKTRQLSPYTQALFTELAARSEARRAPAEIDAH